MPNKQASIKDVRKNKKHSATNLRLKTHVRALLRSFEALTRDGKKEEARHTAAKAQKTISKAAKTGVLHRNKASRLISSIHTALAQK